MWGDAGGHGLELFSQEWAKALRRRINERAGYRRAGAGWDDTVAFLADAGDGDRVRAVFLELRRGECVAARAARSRDLEAASFVIAANAATWHDLLRGRSDLLLAIMRGRFRLRRGTLAALVPHLAAARELLAAAADLETGGS